MIMLQTSFLWSADGNEEETRTRHISDWMSRRDKIYRKKEEVSYIMMMMMMMMNDDFVSEGPPLIVKETDCD